MWLGLLYIPAEESESGDATTIISVYEPHRVWTLGMPPQMAPLIMRGLRDTALETGGAMPPRCESCGELLDVPPLDDLDVACGSA